MICLVRGAWLFLLLLGCGGAEGGLDAGTAAVDAGGESPACARCSGQLDDEAAQCTASFNGCANLPNQDTVFYARCFATDAFCYEAALDRAGTCHDACGDPILANIERCTGDCFVSRGECHGTNLFQADACFENCSGAGCATCRSQGLAQADVCDRGAETCATTCKRTYRGG